MSEKKKMVLPVGFVLPIILFAVSLNVMLMTGYHNRIHFQMLGDFCEKLIEESSEAERPGAEQVILSVLKEYKTEPAALTDNNILLTYGYQQADFQPTTGSYPMIFAAAGFFVGALLFFITLFLWHKKEIMRIKTLTDYLERVNAGKDGVLLQNGEDDFSRLQDEIYKTVTSLHQTREAALKAKKNFADNLYNIAHQMKTPMTSISLSVQMMYKEVSTEMSTEHLEKIKRQVLSLTHLEESLLLLSRIDAGNLSLERKEVDVYTLLMLASDNLQELLVKADVSVHIPEAGEAIIDADLDWTMEAVMNLMKNCMEHTPPGESIYCSYEQNPLYTQIRIWDNGAGFAKEDIPHLFERFYRGKEEKNGGIGIGLAISKEIIESQNGVISAGNRESGGAYFEIRFYFREGI